MYFWSIIGSGFGKPGGTHPYQTFRGIPPFRLFPEQKKQAPGDLSSNATLFTPDGFLLANAPSFWEL